jgi:VanZ family protein
MIKKNLFSIVLALIILYLSLTPGDSFNKISIFNFPHFDKFVHLLMYFTLMSVLIFENRRLVKNIQEMIRMAVIPLTYSIIIEILQSLFTSTRAGSLYDVVFNLAGITIALIIWLKVKPFRNQLFI